MFNSLDLPGLQLPSRCGSKRWLEVGNFCNIQNCYWTRFFLIQKNFFFPTDIEKRHLLTYPLALSLLLIWWFREWEWGWGGMLDIFFFLIHLGKERKWDFFSSSTLQMKKCSTFCSTCIVFFQFNQNDWIKYDIKVYDYLIGFFRLN